jgi:hypothetical protein
VLLCISTPHARLQRAGRIPETDVLLFRKERPNLANAVPACGLALRRYATALGPGDAPRAQQPSPPDTVKCPPAWSTLRVVGRYNWATLFRGTCPPPGWGSHMAMGPARFGPESDCTAQTSPLVREGATLEELSSCPTERKTKTSRDISRSADLLIRPMGALNAAVARGSGHISSSSSCS